MKLTLEIDTSGIGKLPGRWEQAKARALNESAQTMVRFLMQNSPVDHGLLKSWFIESINDEEAHIKSPAEYAIYQDQGTRPHMIRPVNAKALHWEGGGFSKGHMVSGIKGKHFVEQSFNQLKPLVPGYFLRAFEEVQG